MPASSSAPERPPKALAALALALALAGCAEPAALADRAEVSRADRAAEPVVDGICGEGMVLVDGLYTPAAGHRCVQWLAEKSDRCAEYAPPPIVAGKKERFRFCVDRFEYPNLEGALPAVMPDWFDAKEACEAEGKRLCNSSEWTLACEGTELSPYPYGYRRDKDACNIDRPRPKPEPNFDVFDEPRKIADEVFRLDLRVRSGEKERCVSPFGARDMTGNVDEWVVNDDHFAPKKKDGDEKPPTSWVSGLKGGYWGPIRARCRPMTTSHNPWFRFYQVGFRCCKDPSDGSFAGRRFPLPVRAKHRPKGAP